MGGTQSPLGFEALNPSNRNQPCLVSACHCLAGRAGFVTQMLTLPFVLSVHNHLSAPTSRACSTGL